MARVVTLLLFLNLVLGCSSISLNTYSRRGSISIEAVKWFQPRQTSMKDVLFEFGDPQLYRERDRALVYQWTVDH